MFDISSYPHWVQVAIYVAGGVVLEHMFDVYSLVMGFFESKPAGTDPALVELLNKLHAKLPVAPASTPAPTPVTPAPVAPAAPPAN